MDGTRAGYEQDNDADAGVAAFTRVHTTDSCVLEVRGDLDIAVSAALGRELDELLAVGSERIAVDLSGVLFMDSSALGALVRAHERANDAGQQLMLIGPSPACAKVLNITGLDRVFNVR